MCVCVCVCAMRCFAESLLSYLGSYTKRNLTNSKNQGRFAKTSSYTHLIMQTISDLTLCSGTLKRRLQAKSTQVIKVRAILLDWIGVDFIHLGLAVLEIIYFKHNIRASPIITFDCYPDVENTSDATLVLFLGKAAIRLSHRGLLSHTTVNMGFCRFGYCIETSGLPIKIISREAPTSCLE